jgi:hypothetical protein
VGEIRRNKIGKGVRSTNQPKKFYHSYIKRNLKFIPIIGLIVLFAMMMGQKPEDIDATKIENTSFMDRVTETFKSFSKSFDFSDKLKLIFSIILITTIWTGYKYWLARLKHIRRNPNLSEKLIIVIIFVIFIERHVIMDSAIGRYIDWMLFLSFLYIVVAGSWFLAKTIDGMDLSSDLYCWGLRILGLVVAFFGIILFASSSLALTITNSKLIFNNIYWIASVCIILLGAFMEYRSFRRHPAIHVW